MPAGGNPVTGRWPPCSRRWSHAHNASLSCGEGAMRVSAIGIFAAAVIAAPACANDSTAELATGGLVLTRNDDIEMRAEDLFVSAREISVRYRFFNRASRDVTVLVAFPMPDVTIEHQDQNISV